MIFELSSLLISLAIKSTIVLSIAFVLTKFIKALSSTERHFIWCLAFISLMLLPVLTLVVPKYQFTIPAIGFYGLPEFEIPELSIGSTTVTNGPQKSSPIWLNIFNGLKKLDTGLVMPVTYLTIASLFLVYLGLICNRISRHLKLLNEVHNPAILRQVESIKHELKINRNIRVYHSESDLTPWVWGIIRPKVVLPACFSEWSKEEQHNALTHELSHVKRLDLVSFIITRVCCCLYWFHPLVWVGYRNLSMEAEKACDDHVILGGSRASIYASQLMEVANSVFNGSRRFVPVVSMARCSSLSGRVKNILDTDARRDIMKKEQVVLISVITFVFTISLVAFQAIAEQAEYNVQDVDTIVHIQSEPVKADKKDVLNIPLARPELFDQFDEAHQLHEAGNYDQATEILEELKSIPDLNDFEKASITQMLVMNFHKQERYEDAVDLCQEILELSLIPDSMKANVNLMLANLYMKQEDYENAVAKMSEWIATADKVFPQHHINFAMAYFQLEDYQEASVHLNTAHRLLEENNLKPSLGLLEFMMTTYMNLEDVENFNRIVDEANRLYPEDSNFRYYRTANDIDVNTDYMPIYREPPKYPPRAQSRGIEGHVILEFTVTTTGTVKDVTVIDDDPPHIFRNAAIEATKKFKFKPRVKDGKAVETPGVQHKIEFRLEQESDA